MTDVVRRTIRRSGCSPVPARTRRPERRAMTPKRPTVGAPQRPAAARRGRVRRRAGRAGHRRRPAPPAELAAVAVGRGHLPARRHGARRHGDHAEVRRPAPVDRDRRGHAGHRPGAAHPRGAGDGQDVGERAPRGGGQRRLHAPRPGHGRDHRGDPALRLELRPAARRRPERGGARAQPGVPGHADRGHRPHRGAHPHAERRAGCTRHDPVGEDAAGARARRRGAGRTWVQRHRHGQRPRPGCQRPVGCVAPAVQHRRAAAALRPRRGGGHRPASRRTARRGARRCPPSRLPTRRSAVSSPCSASCATGSPRTAG